MPENPKKLTPQELLLNYFTFKRSNCLTIEELVNMAIALGCPDANVAQGVLLNMVEAKQLTWYKEEDTGQVIFCLPTDQDKTQ